MQRLALASLLLASFASAGCGDGPAPAPADGPPARAASGAGEAGLRTFLESILAPGADRAALSAQLRPSSADYAALLKGDAVAKAEAAYAPGWDAGALVLDPGNEARTEIRITPTTTDEIASWSGVAASEFPGGWQSAGEHLQPGHMIYRVEFLEPGADRGMSFDGFVHIDGHWCIFPKLWRFLRD